MAGTKFEGLDFYNIDAMLTEEERARLAALAR